jgi:hypothetical protein
MARLKRTKELKEVATILFQEAKHTTAAAPKAFQPRTSPKKRSDAPVRKTGTTFQSGKRLKFTSATVSGRVDRVDFAKHFAKSAVTKILLSTETGAVKIT